MIKNSWKNIKRHRNNRSERQKADTFCKLKFSMNAYEKLAENEIKKLLESA